MTAPTARLIVLCDGSSMADRALEAALARAAARGETVTLLSAIPARLWRAKQGQFPTSLDEHDEEFAQRVLAEASDRCKAAGVAHDRAIVTGPFAEVIAEEAAKGCAALFVGERRDAWSRPSLGALLREVVSCEVISVP